MFVKGCITNSFSISISSQGFVRLAPACAVLFSFLFMIFLSRNQTIIDLVETTHIDYLFLFFVVGLYIVILIFILVILLIMRYVFSLLIATSRLQKKTSSSGFSPAFFKLLGVLYLLLALLTMIVVLWGIVKLLSSQGHDTLFSHPFGDTVNYQWKTYPTFSGDQFPRHVSQLSTPESLFNSLKLLRVLFSIFEGFLNYLGTRYLPKDLSHFTHPDNFTLLFASPGMSRDQPWLSKDGLWMEDEVFAMQYLRGINPLTIRALSSVPDALDLRQHHIDYLNEHIVPSDYHFDRLLKMKRMYYADYAILSQVVKSSLLFISRSICRSPNMLVLSVIPRLSFSIRNLTEPTQRCFLCSFN